MDVRNDLNAVKAAYRRYAPIYDLAFGKALNAGRRHVSHIVNAGNPKRILEIGVGTGLSLPLYNRNAEIVGIDVSQDMLNVAQQRLSTSNIDNVTLHVMDAGDIGLTSGSFDAVVASYVLSVTPDPHRVLAEMRRLCTPSGVIVICNHSIQDGKRFRLPRRLMDPLSRSLGWRPDFNLFHELREIKMEVLCTRRIPPFGLFTLVTCAP